MSATTAEKRRDSTDANVIALLLIFIVAVVGSYSFFLYAAPRPSEAGDSCRDDMSIVWLVGAFIPPWAGGRGDVVGTIQELHGCAVEYNESFPNWTIAVYVAVYVLLQSFAVPGPLILSILSGALWDVFTAVGLITFSATFGASMCFLLSQALRLGKLAETISPRNYAMFRSKVESNRDNLWFYMLFMRLTPFFPNWFINLASPILGIPFSVFSSATMFGLIPANILHYFTGKNLANMKAGENIFENNGRNFAILFSLQFVALLPVLLKKWLSKLHDNAFADKKQN